MRRKRDVLFVVLLLCCCGGGSSAPVQGPSSDPHGLDIEGGSEGQRAQLAFSIRAVDSIFADPRFWELVKDRRLWLRAPEDDEYPEGTIPAIIEGEEVAGYLLSVRASRASYKLVRVFNWWNPWRWMFAGSTTASTSVCGPIEILRRKIGTVSSLINTVAHENTHRVGMGTGPESCDGRNGKDRYRFWDRGYTAAMVPWLVSYSIGDMAQCFYEEKGEREKTMACLSRNVDDRSECRLYSECCDEQPGWDAKIILNLRGGDPRCPRDPGACATLLASCGAPAHSQAK
jgi:hypothetical protein